MTINEYQKEALRTAPTWWPNPFEPLENGQAIDILKKQLFQGHPPDCEHLAKELGDVAWCLALSAAALGYTLEEILEMNVKKAREVAEEGVDAEPVRHGRWIQVKAAPSYHYCSYCKSIHKMTMSCNKYVFAEILPKLRGEDGRR